MDLDPWLVTAYWGGGELLREGHDLDKSRGVCLCVGRGVCVCVFRVVICNNFC
jgi:hypothetical protein